MELIHKLYTQNIFKGFLLKKGKSLETVINLIDVSKRGVIS
jgi:hypothetical protein